MATPNEEDRPRGVRAVISDVVALVAIVAVLIGGLRVFTNTVNHWLDPKPSEQPKNRP